MKSCVFTNKGVSGIAIFLPRFASKGGVPPLHPPRQSSENRVTEVNRMRTAGTKDTTKHAIPENLCRGNGATGRSRCDTRNDSSWRRGTTSPREQHAKTRQWDLAGSLTVAHRVPETKPPAPRSTARQTSPRTTPRRSHERRTGQAPPRCSSSTTSWPVPIQNGSSSMPSSSGGQRAKLRSSIGVRSA